MEDEEYDLDTLTALLDMEDEGEPDNTTNKNDNLSQDDEEVDLETITSFLEASDDSDLEEDETSIQQKEMKDNKADNRLQETTEATDDNNPKENVEARGSDKKNADVNDLQAQLLMMQEQMAKLKNQLLQQQKQTSPTTKSPLSSEETPQKSKDHKLQSLSSEQTGSPLDHKVKKRQNSEKLRKSPGSSAKKREPVIKSLNNVEKSDQLILDRLLPPTDTEKQKMQQTETQVKNSSSKCSPKNSTSQIVAKCHKKAITSNRDMTREDLNPFFDDENDATAKRNIKQVEQDLKLESDDSDSEGLDGEKKCKLSDEGREISNLLKKEGNTVSRVSHVSSHDVADLRKKAAKTQWKEKSLASHSGTEVKSSPTVSKEENIPSVTDPFSGIRIV